MIIDSPVISVIIPVYNVEKYIDRCLDSLRNQTVHNFEAILIDDGSTDSSGSICDKYSQMDERFRVQHVPNGGVSAARNLGLSLAIGKYVTFVDSDDSIESNYLELLMNQPDNVDLVIMGVKFLDESSAVIEVKSYQASEKLVSPSLANDVFRDSSLWYSVSKRYKRQVLVDNAICFDSSLSMGEDTLFVLHYLRCCKIVITIESTPYRYYRSGSGTLSSRRLDTYERIDAANEKMSDFLDAWHPGAGSTPEMKHRFWLSFYYASFYILQDSTSSFCTKFKQLHKTFSRTKTRLSASDIWEMTHVERPVFRVLLTLRRPVLLLSIHEILTAASKIRRNRR